MKILVTGGAGFIGSHVTQAYIDAGHDVVVVDDLSTGRRSNVPSQARFVELDICDRERLDAVFAREKPDVVNHHAAQVAIPVSLERPWQDAHVNIMGMLALLECSARHGVSRFIYASTAAVYGQPMTLPVDEDHPIRPLNPYGVGKYAAELYLRCLGDLRGMDWVILRYANVYGPRQDPSGEAGVIAIFIDRMKRGEAPVVFGDGQQTRDFVYVEDVAQANLAALGARKLVVNVATGRETAIADVAKLLAEFLGFEGAPRFAPPRAGEVRRSCLSPDRAGEVLGWRPRTPLEEGLRRVASSG